MTLFMPDLIRRKRNGDRLKADEIKALICQYARGDVPDYQVAALLMAIFFRGLDSDELNAWTDAMLHSGEVLDLRDIPGIKVDKHSTGGVGDKISLCLAPAVASLGVPIPMISGRGLGHTGGTLDKLESIPGFQIDLSMGKAKKLLADLGIFLIGQTADLAPADKKLYRLRDVTGTVESIPLIASSIMSKKIAEGMDGLVLDVKVGEGAFMTDLDQARELAHTMIGIGKGAGKTVRALLTNMACPIGLTVGNALEMGEAIAVMQGAGPSDTVELTKALGAEMLMLGGKAEQADEGRTAVERVLQNGRALAHFAKVIEAQGGDPGVCEDPTRLPTAKEQQPIVADRDGFISKIRPRIVAQAALEVGAGRRTKEDKIDPATGVKLHAKVGDSIVKGQPVATLHHHDTGAETAAAMLVNAFEISDSKPSQTPLIIEKL
ncbi:MAG: thymidine phosphorylase [Proteobacteria bacterium]|nr:thymidine phosphorylase [Pseudomonadota bacterium]